MTMKFSDIATDVCRLRVPHQGVVHALEVLGAKADHVVEDLDTEHRMRLVGQFARALRNVGVHEATRIERDLYEAVGAGPKTRRPVVIKDAISLVTVRNHVQQLTTALGVPWAEGMQIQSAVSDVARFVAANGGGQIETEALSDGRIHFVVRIERHLPPISVGGGAAPPWLIGVEQLAERFHMTRDAHATKLELWIPWQQAMVA